MEKSKESPTVFVDAGIETIQDKFVWKVENFSLVKKAKVFHSIIFEAWKKNSELVSQWKFTPAFLGDSYLGFKIESVEPPKCGNLCNVSVEFSCFTRAKNGRKSENKSRVEKLPMLVAEPTEVAYVPVGDDWIGLNGCLTMHWTATLLKLKCTSNNAASSVVSCCKISLEHFQSASKVKAVMQILKYADQEAPIHDITITAKDGTKFTASKYILAARSPVMEAMFKREGITGTFHMAVVSGPTLKVLLHFINKGELLPEWSGRNVVLELAYAAFRYQIMDLLDFLDNNLGECCALEDVAEFIAAARKFSLNTAKQHLLDLFKNKADGQLAEELKKMML